MSENRFSKYLLYALGEITLVVIGILIALQINSWNENRKNNNSEKTYLAAIAEDLRSDIEANERIISNATKIIVSVENILQVLETDSNFEELNWASVRTGCTNDTIQFIISLGRTGFFSTPEVYDYTFDDLKSSGKTGLIRDSNIKKALYEYYAVLGRIESWAEIKRQAHLRMNDFLSKTLPADLRMWANNDNDVNQKEWANKKPNVEVLMILLRSQQGLEAALEDVKYSHKRLIVESDWRIDRAENMLGILKGHTEEEN